MLPFGEPFGLNKSGDWDDLPHCDVRQQKQPQRSIYKLSETVHIIILIKVRTSRK